MTLRRSLLAAVVAVALVAAACGDDDADEGASGQGGNEVGTTTEAPDTEPRAGGRLVLGMYSEPRSLDPIQASGAGTGGGTEMMALFDTVMQWDPETNSHVPRTAESLTPNDDFTSWVLKLRPGISFRDGTPYDARAMELSIQRHKSASGTSRSKSYLDAIEKVTVLDDLTVRFDLNQSWPGFPYLLADAPGMLVSPTAIAALGDPNAPDYKEKLEAFGLNPVGAGAGPFEIVSFRPGEAITMRRHEGYWGGTPYLDEIRFVVVGGSAQTYESLKSGDIDFAFIRSGDVTQRAKEEGVPGIERVTQTGEVLLMNMGVSVVCNGQQPAPLCTGRSDGERVKTTPPTASKAVRQAIAAAIDPQVIDERAYNGRGLPGTELLQESFAWYPGVPGPEYDPDEARRLVEQAKAEGWDGKVRLLCTNQPDRQASSLAIETMLESVGMEVEVETQLSTQDQISRVVTQKNFDLACWGLPLVNDDGATLALQQNLLSASPTNRVGYASAEMDEALGALKLAVTDEERVDAFRRVAQIYNEDLPLLALQAIPIYLAHRENVHGIVGGHDTTFYLDDAWVEQ
ncbi:MAG TPA: ABC transporter substrate-binding protein [Acidimicrobiales bacterium]